MDNKLITLSIVAMIAGGIYTTRADSAVMSKKKACNNEQKDNTTTKITLFDRFYTSAMKGKESYFYWSAAKGIFDQIDSECMEVEKELASSPINKKTLMGEIGDLIHATISLAIFYGINLGDTLENIGAMQYDKECSNQKGDTYLLLMTTIKSNIATQLRGNDTLTKSNFIKVLEAIGYLVHYFALPYTAIIENSIAKYEKRLAKLLKIAHNRGITSLKNLTRKEKLTLWAASKEALAAHKG